MPPENYDPSESQNVYENSLRINFPDNKSIVSEIGFGDFYKGLEDFEQKAFEEFHEDELIDFFYQIAIALGSFEKGEKIISFSQRFNIPLSQEAKVFNDVPEYPDYVYFNVEERYLPLFLTYPGEGVDNIPQNPSFEPGDEASLKVRNTKRFTVSKNSTSQILEVDDYGITHKQLAPGLLKFLSENKGITERLDISVFWKTLEKIANINSWEHSQDCSEYIKRRNKGVEIETNFKENIGNIEGIYFRGEYYEGDRINDLRKKYEEETEVFGALTSLEKGDYLYRAPRGNEWDEIVRNKGYFCVRNETNFESGVDSQVQMYSETEGYAGRIIRIKLEGPYVRNAGMQVPRLTSFTAFYAKVEVLDGDEWKSFEDYIRETSQ